MAYINGEEILFSSTVNISEGGGVSSEEIVNLQNQINNLTEKHDNEIQTLTDKDTDLQTQINNLGSGGGASVKTETFSTASDLYTKLSSLSPEKILYLKLKSSSSISASYTGLSITTTGVSEGSETENLITSSYTFFFTLQAVTSTRFYFVCNKGNKDKMTMQLLSSGCTIQSDKSEYSSSVTKLYTAIVNLDDYIADGTITLSLSYIE